MSNTENSNSNTPSTRVITGSWFNPGFAVSAVTVALIAIVPLLSYWMGHLFWIDLFTRLVILSLAALSLNLLLGCSGLASFGHAVYLGIGAYAVGIPAYHATYGGVEWLASYSGYLHFAIAIVASALFALLTGAISLRTKGIHFIMITMAFSQMIYYTLVSIEEYGADDGLTIDLRSEFSTVNLDDPVQLFLICYVSMLAFMFIIHRLMHSRFGRILEGAKQNPERMLALGVQPYRYQLVAFVIAGAMCGYAGALMANYSTFISPSIIEWTRSGELMFMIILGGTSYLLGPVLGAALFILIEYYLSSWTIYWHLPFGILLILTVLLFRGGVAGMVSKGVATVFVGRDRPRD